MDIFSQPYLLPSHSSITCVLEPLWGTAFAAVALGEQVGINTFFGKGLILTELIGLV